MPPLLRYQLDNALSRLHRARVLLHARGWKALLSRATSAAPAAAGQPTSEAPTTQDPEVLDVAKTARPLSVLWVDEQLPDPARDSGSLRMFNLLRVLVAMGHAVDVLILSSAGDAPGQKLLQGIGVRRVGQDAGLRPEAWFVREGARYDAVIVSRYHLAWSWFPLLRRAHPRALRIVDTVDLHHVRELGEATLHGHALLASAAKATRRHELRAIAEADVAWVVSDAERTLLQQAAPGSRVEVVSNIHVLAASARGKRSGARLVFVGGAQHPPNMDGVRWLLTDVLPEILHRRPECELHLVGRDLKAGTQGLAVPSGVVFHGQLHDVGSLFDACQVGLAPLRFGAGVKGKINHYMASGLPTVATPCAVEGMYLKEGRDVLVAQDASAFADAVLRVLEDGALWESLSLHGRENVRRHFSIESAIPGIRATFDTHAPDRVA